MPDLKAVLLAYLEELHGGGLGWANSKHTSYELREHTRALACGQRRSRHAGEFSAQTHAQVMQEPCRSLVVGAHGVPASVPAPYAKSTIPAPGTGATN